MKEIQQQIKNCEIKANRQVATYHIPKCLSCSKNKGKKGSHKQHSGSITQDDNHPGSNTSIDHVDADNVPGYPWQHKGCPTLKKYKNFMIFVDHKTRLVYPSFRNQRLHLKPVILNATMRNSHSDTKSRSNHIMPKTEHFVPKHFKKKLTTKTNNLTSVA
jgi:hypothetical protein